MKRKEFEYCIKENQLIQTGDIDTALASELLNAVIPPVYSPAVNPPVPFGSQEPLGE